MKKDFIFLGVNGLTSTSANFIANIAKEMYQEEETKLDNVRFYTTTISLIGSTEKHTISEGVNTTCDICPSLERIAKLKSLIAWLREGIKAKENLIKEVASATYKDYDMIPPERPVKEDYITADDVIGTFRIKELNRYYHLETFCATIGKYIHNNGSFSKEREKLHKVIVEPHEVDGSGRDAILYTKKPSVHINEVEDTFMNLQQLYREYQAEQDKTYCRWIR
jgi:hypothetical protein